MSVPSHKSVARRHEVVLWAGPVTFSSDDASKPAHDTTARFQRSALTAALRRTIATVVIVPTSIEGDGLRIAANANDPDDDESSCRVLHLPTFAIVAYAAAIIRDDAVRVLIVANISNEREGLEALDAARRESNVKVYCMVPLQLAPDAFDRLTSIAVESAGDIDVVTASAHVDAIPNSTAVMGYDANKSLKLQIAALRPVVMDVLQGRASRCAMVVGPTGSGKSTVVPLALIAHIPGAVLWCTQPRRMAAANLCARINELRCSTTDAAYSIGGQPLDADVEMLARIVFMTPGVLLQRLRSACAAGTFLRSPSANVTHLVIDEAHERSLDTDLILGFVRVLLLRNRNLRVIVMSATLELQSIRTYLYRCQLPTASVELVSGHRVSEDPDAPSSSTVCGTGPWKWPETSSHAATALIPVVAVTPPGFGHFLAEAPLPTRHVVYLEHWKRHLAQDDAGGFDDEVLETAAEVFPKGKAPQLTPQRMEAVKLLIAHLHVTRPASESFLVFLSGLPIIEKLRDALTNLRAFSATSSHPRAEIVVLHSSTGLEAAHAVFDRVQKGAASDPQPRLIILSSNIAESSVTIPSVDHVIDTCLMKESRYSFVEALYGLEEVWCAKDNCAQRAGRTGRVRPGTVWRVVTKREFDTFRPTSLPAFVSSTIAEVILFIADACVGNVFAFLYGLLTPPEPRFVNHAIHDLLGVYRAVRRPQLPQADGVYHPTAIGTILSTLPVDMPLAMLLCLGAAVGSTWPVIQVVAIASCSTRLFARRDFQLEHRLSGGTHCSAVAEVQMYRAALRGVRNDDSVAGEYTGAAVSKQALIDVTWKAIDMGNHLAAFGLHPCRLEPMADLTGVSALPHDFTCPLDSHAICAFLVALIAAGAPHAVAPRPSNVGHVDGRSPARSHSRRTVVDSPRRGRSSPTHQLRSSQVRAVTVLVLFELPLTAADAELVLTEARAACSSHGGAVERIDALQWIEDLRDEGKAVALSFEAANDLGDTLAYSGSFSVPMAAIAFIHNAQCTGSGNKLRKITCPLNPDMVYVSRPTERRSITTARASLLSALPSPRDDRAPRDAASPEGPPSFLVVPVSRMRRAAANETVVTSGVMLSGSRGLLLVSGCLHAFFGSEALGNREPMPFVDAATHRNVSTLANALAADFDGLVLAAVGLRTAEGADKAYRGTMQTATDARAAVRCKQRQVAATLRLLIGACFEAFCDAPYVAGESLVALWREQDACPAITSPTALPAAQQPQVGGAEETIATLRITRDDPGFLAAAVIRGVAVLTTHGITGGVSGRDDGRPAGLGAALRRSLAATVDSNQRDPVGACCVLSPVVPAAPTFWA